MLKETLERFREKFKSKTCDCDSICEIHKIEEYEQFIIEEIKLAVEEIVKSRNAENTYSVNTFEAGYKAKEFEIQWNLNKYFEV
jgi:hypothetical protein